MERVVDYTELCRYDNALKYAVEVEVYSDKFILGNKEDVLRFAVSDYGFRRLLKDSLDGLIDIRETSLTIEAFYYPEITYEEIEENIKEQKDFLRFLIEHNISINSVIFDRWPNS